MAAAPRTPPAANLENELQCKLNLAFWGRRSNQRTRDGVGGSSAVEDIGVAITNLRGRKVRVIKDVENLHAELHVEVFRDSLDVVVLEHGKVQVGYPRADENVTPRIASQIEALRKRGKNGRSSRGVLGTGRRRVAIRIPKVRVWCRGNGKALCFDVRRRVARICQCLAS